MTRQHLSGESAEPARADPDPPPHAEAPVDPAHRDPRESAQSDQLPETAQREVAEGSQEEKGELTGSPDDAVDKAQDTIKFGDKADER